jgi:hypothetical protein
VDYYSYSGQLCFILCISDALMVSRYGNVYFSVGFGVGSPNLSEVDRFGWVDQSGRGPTPTQLNTFINGRSDDVNMSGEWAFGPDFQETWGNPGQVGSHNFATEAGLGLGVFAGSAETTYTWDLFHI